MDPTCSRQWLLAVTSITMGCAPYLTVSAQHRLAKARAFGDGAGSPGPTLPASKKNGQRGSATRPEDNQRGEGEHLTPDATHNGEWSPPPGKPPATPAACGTPQGAHAKEPVPGPHTCTPAPTERGQTPAASRKDGQQQGEGERLTADVPHDGARRPLRKRPPATPTMRNTVSQERAPCSQCWVPTPANPRTQQVGSGPRLPAPRTGSSRRRESA